MAVVSELDLFDPSISPYWRVLASEVTAALKAAGQLTQLYIGHAEPGAPSDEPTCPHFWEDVAAGRIGGAVLIDLPETPAWAQRVINSPVPMVGDLTGFQVVTDSCSIMSAAVRHFVDAGCRRLGLISWHGEKPFRRIVAEAGAVTSEAWIRTHLDPAIPGAGWEEFCDIWSSKEGRPDGLIFLDDVLYADAQLAIFEMGVRVPDTLRIALMSSRNACPNVRLPLTLYEFDPAKIAAEYVGLLLDRIEGRIHEPTDVHMPFQRRVVSQAALSK
jgi:DNA-binding LacI/PurR family transcriptional regulator